MLSFNLPLIWQKKDNDTHIGYLTNDITFRVERRGKGWVLYSPYNVVRALPANDANEAVDAANVIVLEHWKEIISEHLKILPVTDLFNPLPGNTREEYEILLKLTTNELREKYLSAGRK